MKVLGIDPGYGRCGVAVVERLDGKEHLVFSDCIETSSKDPFEERLAAIIATCDRLMGTHRPDAVALEKLYFGTNKTTAMRVSEVRGALIATATARDIPSHEYAPAQIKSATSGFGRADKRQVAMTVRMLLSITKEIRLDDEYDAIAVALTHLAHSRA